MKLRPVRKHDGVTLTELMIVLAVLGILVGVVAPNFTSLMARFTVASETKRMISILKQARNEARARGATVTISRNTADDWGGRVLVYETTTIAGNAAYSVPAAMAAAIDDLISEYPATSATVSIGDDATANGQFISFSRQGWLSTSELSEITLSVCSPSLPDEDGMYIEINRVGKIREQMIGSDTRGCL
jgi:prepilin-type N-terminal cleavage/methylation domain-containing protein